PRHAHVAVAVLRQAERGLDRILVERVDDPVRAGEIDGAILDLGLERRVGDSLEGDQDLLHYELLRSRPCVMSAPTQSAARTISNCWRGGASPASGVLSPSSQASAISSSSPKIMRAATGGGMRSSNTPAAWPSPMMPASRRRRSANLGFCAWPFMNLADWRS